MNAAQRRLRARLGGLATKAAGTVNVGPSHAAFLQRFIDQVDPDRTLPDAERMARAIAARKLHMNRLALSSSLARSKKARPDRNSGRAIHVEDSPHVTPRAA